MWSPETFTAPDDWRTSAQNVTNEDFPGVLLIVPHPHGIVFSKLARREPRDLDHIAHVLRRFPLSAAVRRASRGTLAANPPEVHERRVRFEAAYAAMMRGPGGSAALPRRRVALSRPRRHLRGHHLDREQ